MNCTYGHLCLGRAYLIIFMYQSPECIYVASSLKLVFSMFHPNFMRVFFRNIYFSLKSAKEINEKLGIPIKVLYLANWWTSNCLTFQYLHVKIGWWWSRSIITPPFVLKQLLNSPNSTQYVSMDFRLFLEDLTNSNAFTFDECPW